MSSMRVWMAEAYPAAFFLHLFAVTSLVAASSSEGDIRLVDGDAPNQGRIEIYSNSTWWKLCSSRFYGQAFETVCRQLNRPLPSQKLRNSDFGAGNLTYLSTTFYCDTTKSSLLNCWQPWQYGHCGAENSVGVVCGDMVYAACGVGGRQTSISGHLEFTRGPKPHEVQCEWAIDLSSDHIILMLPSYENQGYCGNPEIRVKKPSGEEVLYMYRCANHDAVVKLVHSSSINLTVKMWGKFNSPPFLASYVEVSGGLRAATLLSSWIPTTTNITHNSFAVQWPLLTNQINQPVSAYVVLANWTTVYGGHQLTGKIVLSNATSATIRRIPSFRSYQVIVVAVDASGRPFNSSAVYVRTLEGDCAGPLSLTDSNATIQSPGYPCYYGGIQRCRWSIIPGRPTSAIWIFFEEFRLSFYNYESPYCSANDGVGITEGPSQNEVFFCNHMEGVFVLIRGNRADISFTATRGWQNQGFKARYIAEQTAITETPLPSWTISSSSVKSTSVNIEWSQFPLSLHSAQQMALMVTEPNREMFVFVRVDKWQRSKHIGNLSPNREYLFKVVVFTGINPNNVTYASQNISLRTNPGAPSCPPTNIRLETVQSTNLLVRWDGLPQECENGQLGGYKVYYRRSYYWGVAYNVTAGPSDTQVMITGLNQLAEYSVWITAFTFKEGPKSQSQSIVIGCGASFNQTFGMVNLTKMDRKDQICFWEMWV
ncbi:scavenger receptor cysteine-rich domain-containing protein DMBT1-like isoform X2 [Acropora palmata]|uniref:scavenger receptor cysteine-rich domain-containing protein DMBT1-like isoform X2 n=1 Tax=Acropora palmata TaxID=6131 RepID=UPI003DA074F5